MLTAGSSGGVEYIYDADLRGRGFLLAFSTRIGGVSDTPFDTLNFSARSSDDPGKVIANRRLFSKALGVSDADLTFADQVHGAAVSVVGPETAGAGSRPAKPPIPATDAMVTDMPGVPLVIMTADCVPVLLVDPEAGIVGAAHAGWRGTFDRIASNTVEAMVERGAVADRIRARIGPAIGPCCYEVDQELYDRFGARFDLAPPAGKTSLDLPAVNEAILRESGLRSENIEAVGQCTACDEERFYSWRRSKDGGRLASVAAII